jgi:hypothetical protein
MFYFLVSHYKRSKDNKIILKKQMYFDLIEILLGKRKNNCKILRHLSLNIE